MFRRVENVLSARQVGAMRFDGTMTYVETVMNMTLEL